MAGSKVPRDPNMPVEVRRFLDDLARVQNIFNGLSATEATALLNVFTGDSGSGGVKGLVPAPAAGDAAANKFLKSDATWAAVTTKVLQCLQTTYTAAANLTAQIPADDSVPGSGEGTEVLSLAITPASASNMVLAIVHVWGTLDNSVTFATAALFRGTTCINAAQMGIIGSGSEDRYQAGGPMATLDSPASASAVTYSVRVGPSGANILTLNGVVSTRRYGGASACTLTLLEIAA